jgi:hypothetical protein
MNHQTLEAAALAAHRRGQTWNAFWDLHADEIRACEPCNRRRFGQLYRRLMAIVASGNTTGMASAGDDDAKPQPEVNR